MKGATTQCRRHVLTATLLMSTSLLLGCAAVHEHPGTAGDVRLVAAKSSGRYTGPVVEVSTDVVETIRREFNCLVRKECVGGPCFDRLSDEQRAEIPAATKKHRNAGPSVLIARIRRGLIEFKALPQTLWYQRASARKIALLQQLIFNSTILEHVDEDSEHSDLIAKVAAICRCSWP